MNEWIIVGIVAIAVIFGATKLPEIARNLGRSSNEFKRGLKEGSEDEPPRTAVQPAQPVQPVQQPVQPVEPKPADPSASDELGPVGQRRRLTSDPAEHAVHERP